MVGVRLPCIAQVWAACLRCFRPHAGVVTGRTDFIAGGLWNRRGHATAHRMLVQAFHNFLIFPAGNRTGKTGKVIAIVALLIAEQRRRVNPAMQHALFPLTS